MVISSIRGGLGNQLFQYSAGRRLAAIRHVSLKLDLSWFFDSPDVLSLGMFPRYYRLHEFNIEAEVATSGEIDRFTITPLNEYDIRRMRGVWWRFSRNHFPSFCRGLRIYEYGPNFDSRILRLPGKVCLDGWWQSENYFRDFAASIRKELTLRDSTIEEHAISDLNSHRRKHHPLVAVQVRRGDVARAHEVLEDLSRMPYELVSQDYLHRAMATFGPDATFVVFSETNDDVDWCRTHLHANDIHFICSNNDMFDFVAMSRCDHNIISNSSFGWWAAWLNPNPTKTVVAPRRWFRSEYAPDFDIYSMIPPEWTVI